MKYTSTCVYDDKSTEISTELDLKTSLERDVSFEESSFESRTETIKQSGSGEPEKYAAIGAGVGAVAGTLLFPGVGTVIGAAVGGAAAGLFLDQVINSRETTTSYSEARNFEKNEKFQESREESLKTNTVSFEARAVCTEFEASYSPYATREYDYIFETAIKELPVPFNPNSPVHVDKYKRFFDAYGTHVVSQVVLGGKRIVTTRMSSTEYSSLVAEDVDVSETLSYEMSSGLATSNVMNLAAVKAASSAASNLIQGALGDSKDPRAQAGTAVASAVDVLVQTLPDEPYKESTEEVKQDFTKEFSRNREQAESAAKISTKKTFTSEITIGGSPDADWRSWSKTVREKPMPVSYSLTPLIDFMTFEQGIAFNDALKSIYGQYIGPGSEADTYPLNMHMGVYRGDGESLSDIPYNQLVTLRSRITRK